MQIFVCKLAVLLSAIGNKATKPKQCLSATGTNKMLQQAGRIMKLTAVLLLGVCMQIYAAGYGQKITLSERDAPIEKVLKKIQQQTSYKFLYTSQLLSGVPKVTVVVKDASVQDVLDLVLKGQMLDYEVSDETVVIKPKVKVNSMTSVEKAMNDPIDVSGKVTDGEGRPLPGANVKVRGTSIGVTTDNNGLFVLKNVSENAVLEITFVGHEMKTFTVRSGAFVSIALDQKLSLLDETVVIAYGTTTRRFSTGNVASVKGSDIQKQPINNPLLGLQGRVPGLFITQTTGVNGGAVRVNVQGQNSIVYGNDPLYVIDGIPYPSMLPSTGVDNIFGSSSAGSFHTRGNPLNYINVSDIQSVEVLKDADATSIYGSRAANGAILITTKKGVSGRLKIDIDLKHGWGKVVRRLDLLNSRQYLDMRYQAFKNDNATPSLTGFPPAYDLLVWDTTRDTDWQSTLIGGTAQYSNASVNFSGGTQNIRYLIGTTYYKESTVFPGNLSDQKTSTHFNLNSNSSNQKFKLDLSGTFLTDKNHLPANDLTQRAMALEPVAPPLYNSDGTLNWEPTSTGTSTWVNPLAELLYSSYQNKTDNLISSASVSYSLLPGLELRSTLGFTKMWTNDFTSTPLSAMRPERRSRPRTATYGNRTIDTWTIEPQISYRKYIYRSKFEGLIGTSFQKNDNKVQTIAGTGYNSDEVLSDIKSAATISALQTVATTYKYNALFGRINYTWGDKYIINLTGRRDGSSRFGNRNQFNNFWSVGGAWIFSVENFTKKSLPFLSFGKIKGSYGITGNDLITDYVFLSLYNVVNADLPYQNTTGLFARSLSNPYIQWEETRKLQAGLELGFLNDKFVINATYVQNRSSNQLLSYTLPMQTGFQSIIDNFPATVQNTNWEFSLNIVNFRSNHFSWTTSANLTIPRNKLVAFPNLSTSTYSDALVIGQPITIKKVLQFEGVNPQTGAYRFIDSAGNITNSPTSKDRNILLNTLPRYYGGLENSIQYKRFELDFLFQFVKQIGPQVRYSLNSSIAPGASLAGFSNQPTSALENVWKKTGDDATIQKFTTDVFDAGISRVASSDAGYSDASFIRLKNISLSWQIPTQFQNKIGIQNSTIYAQGQNLFTISKYKGIDPETQNIGTLPPLRVIVIGLRVSI